jgi:hypothetical protein
MHKFLLPQDICDGIGVFAGAPIEPSAAIVGALASGRSLGIDMPDVEADPILEAIESAAVWRKAERERHGIMHQNAPALRIEARRAETGTGSVRSTKA